MLHRIARAFLLLSLAGVIVPVAKADAQAASGPKVLEAPPRVMVYPFAPMGDPGRYAWVGAGVQQSLMVEATRPGVAAAVMPGSLPTTQPAEGAPPFDPVAEATKAGAAIVVVGNYQIVDDSIRLTGQAIDTSNHQSVATLTAT